MKTPVIHKLILITASLLWAMVARAADNLQVEILMVTGAQDDYELHRAGAELGVTEGNIQGRFLGINYVLRTQNSAGDLAVTADALPAAVVVAGPENLLRQVQAAYAPHNVAVFNIALADDSLRQACFGNVFHTPPSASMLTIAKAQWQQANPGTQVTAQAWHPGFVKFAGRDLNRRFMAQFGQEMNSDAWAGWAATRGLAEAVVRTMSNDPGTLSAFLRESLAFDGQKGVAQSYRVTGQLRQPLLITENGNLLGEAPVRGVADANDLDSLSQLECL